MQSEPVHAKTYLDGKTYTLTGKLRRRTYHHGGNGLKLTGYTLDLGREIMISSTRYNTFKGKEVDINTNMLSVKNFSKLNKWVGKRVKVKGVIMIPDSLWWWYTGGVILASRVTR